LLRPQGDEEREAARGPVASTVQSQSLEETERAASIELVAVPVTRNVSLEASTEYQEDENDYSEEASLLGSDTTTKPQNNKRTLTTATIAASIAPKAGQRTLFRVLNKLQKVLPIPLLACIMGILVGITPPVKKLFFNSCLDSETDIAGNECSEEDMSYTPPLDVISHWLETMGNATIPTLLIVLGATLGSGPGEGSRSLGVRSVIGVCVTRLIFIPFLGFTAIVLLRKINFASLDDQEPLFLATLMVSHAMPTAINVGSLAMLNNYAQKEVAAVLFWQYVFCSVTMTGWTMAAIALTVEK